MIYTLQYSAILAFNMKWDLLMNLFTIGAVAGYGAWTENRVYNYKLHSYTRNSDGGVAAHGRLSIYPLSDNLLLGRIGRLEYSKVDRQLTEDNLDWSGMDFSYQLPINKPFQIHLENGAIHSISVDSTLTKDQINQLKVIVSQFQVDTNAQYLLKSEGEHLPEEGSTNAFFKTMEPTFTGNCETMYDISTLSDYLVRSQPIWIPLLNLNERRGDFIKIEKTTNFNNCNERNRNFAFYKNGERNVQSNSNSNFNINSYSDKMSAEQLTNRMNQGSSPIVTRIFISGDLRTYSIQSSITTANGGGFYDYMEITLESVEERNIQRMVRFEGKDGLVNVGNLVFGTDLEDGERHAQNSGRPVNVLQNLRPGGNCRQAEEWTACWTAFPSAYPTCKNAFTPEWEVVGTNCCGFLCLSKQAKCRLSCSTSV